MTYLIPLAILVIFIGLLKLMDWFVYPPIKRKFVVIAHKFGWLNFVNQDLIQKYLKRR